MAANLLNSTANLSLTGTGGTIRLEGGISGKYVGFKAPDTEISANEILWELPDSDGTTNQVLATDGNKKLIWLTPSPSVETPQAITDTLDASSYDVFTATYATSPTIAIQNVTSGKNVLFAVTATNTITLTFTAAGYTIKWPNGTPLLTVSSGTTTIYNIMCIGTTLYIAAAQGFA